MEELNALAMPGTWSHVWKVWLNEAMLGPDVRIWSQTESSLPADEALWPGAL